METHKNEGTLRSEPEEGRPMTAAVNGTDAASGVPADLSESDDKKHGPNKVLANNTRRLRMERMMSKAELARRAGVSTLTIDRVERGMNCRMDTKRKIIEALGLKPSDRALVFAEDE